MFSVVRPVIFSWFSGVCPVNFCIVLPLIRFKSYAMRSRAFPEGLPNLPEHRQEKVKLGNALAIAAIHIARAQEKAGRGQNAQ